MTYGQPAPFEGDPLDRVVKDQDYSEHELPDGGWAHPLEMGAHPPPPHRRRRVQPLPRRHPARLAGTRHPSSPGPSAPAPRSRVRREAADAPTPQYGRLRAADVGADRPGHPRRRLHRPRPTAPRPHPDRRTVELTSPHQRRHRPYPRGRSHHRRQAAPRPQPNPRLRAQYPGPAYPPRPSLLLVADAHVDPPAGRTRRRTATPFEETERDIVTAALERSIRPYTRTPPGRNWPWTVRSRRLRARRRGLP